MQDIAMSEQEEKNQLQFEFGDMKYRDRRTKQLTSSAKVLLEQRAWDIEAKAGRQRRDYQRTQGVADSVSDINIEASRQAATTATERAAMMYGRDQQIRDVTSNINLGLSKRREEINKITDPREKARELREFGEEEKKAEAEKAQAIAQIHRSHESELKSLAESAAQDRTRAFGDAYTADVAALKESWNAKIRVEEDAAKRQSMVVARDAAIAAKSAEMRIAAERRDIGTNERISAFKGDTYGGRMRAIESSTYMEARAAGLIDEKTGKYKDYNQLDEGQRRTLDSLDLAKRMGLAQTDRERGDRLRDTQISAEQARLRTQGRFQQAEVIGEKRDMAKELRAVADDPQLLKEVLSKQAAEAREKLMGNRKAEMFGSVSEYLNSRLMASANNDQSAYNEQKQAAIALEQAAVKGGEAMEKAARALIEDWQAL
jgi:hypothetical protein